jgi:branched-chain amino acid transport system permease protein
MRTDVLIVSQALYLGCVYALMATGLTITYSATRVINFAQGEYFVFGAAIAYVMQSVYHLPVWVAALTVIAGGGLLGLVSERAIMLPIERSGIHFAWIISTIAVALILESIYGNVFTSAVLRPPPTVGGSVTIFGAPVSLQIFVVIIAAFAIMAVYSQFLRRTVYGSAIRATAHDPETTSSFGVSIRTVVVVSFVISAVITALAGMLVSSILFITPTVGLSYTTSGFVALVLGGLGSSRGAIVGGLIVGLLNALVVNLIGPNLGQIVTVSILAVILIVRPTGIFASPVASH